ncbi:MAG: ABC transporter substrate-binding protein [Novosphingobium sp.]
MRGESSRRDFLALAGAAGAGLLLPGLAGCGRDNGQDLADGPPRRGGRIRMGVIEPSRTGNLDAHKPTGTSSTIRGFALYAKLWEWSDDMFPQLALAEFAEPNADATAWTIRLRRGLEFHNGKTITADDVIFSVLRLTDPTLASPNGASVSLIDRTRVKKLDERTVVIPIRDGLGFLPLPDTWVNFGGIVPPDYHPIANPVGAGPYKLKDFQPGRRSLFTRFENYFREGAPYPDEVEIIDFKDQVTRFEALIAGQIDLAPGLAPEQAPLFARSPALKLVRSQTNWWRGFNMNVTKPPFDDVRVRQAFRLLIDREDLVKRVLHGEGRIGNDLYAPHDPTFAGTIPQRPHDVEQARRLLREAGKENLTVELTADAGGTSSALVLAEQAAKIGITINVRQVDAPTFSGPRKNDFAFSTAGTLGQPYLAAAMSNDGPYSQTNRTNFRDPRFQELILKAMHTPDLDQRKPLLHEAQAIQHERGGLIVWGFQNSLDGISPKVGGVKPERSHFPTWRFDRVWLKG